MAKRNRISSPELPPQVGDKVYPANSQMLYEISYVSHDGAEVNLHIPGTNLERFRVRADSLTLPIPERLAKTASHSLACRGRIAGPAEITLKGLHLPISDPVIFHVPE